MAGDVRLCIACAEEIKAEARLCKHCKTAQDDPRWSQQSQTKRDDTVVLNPDEQRVPQGSMTPEEWDARGAVEVKKGSEEHENAGSAFDPTVQPKPDDLVPADGIWAVFPWPGPLRSDLVPADGPRQIRRNFSMSWVTFGDGPTQSLNAALEPRSIRLAARTEEKQ